MKHCCRILTLFICLLNIYFAQGENRYIYLGSSSNQRVTSAHKWSLLSIEITDDYIKLYHKCTPTKAPTWICSSHNQLIEDSCSSLKSYIYKSDIGFEEQKYILNGYHDKYFYEYYTPLPKHVTHINIRDEKGFYVVKNLDIRESEYSSAIPEDAIFCIQDTCHPFYDRAEQLYLAGDYNNALANLEQSLKCEYHNIAQTYTYLIHCCDKTGDLHKWSKYIKEATSIFTPISRYATDKIFAPFVAYIYNQLYHTQLMMSLPKPLRAFNVEERKAAIKLKQKYDELITYLIQYMVDHQWKSVYAQYGFLKYLLGESDYKKYLQLAGDKGQEYESCIQENISSQNRNNHTSSSKVKGLTKDPNFKIK